MSVTQVRRAGISLAKIVVRRGVGYGFWLSVVPFWTSLNPFLDRRSQVGTAMNLMSAAYKKGLADGAKVPLSNGPPIHANESKHDPRDPV